MRRDCGRDACGQAAADAWKRRVASLHAACSAIAMSHRPVEGVAGTRGSGPGCPVSASRRPRPRLELWTGRCKRRL